MMISESWYKSISGVEKSVDCQYPCDPASYKVVLMLGVIAKYFIDFYVFSE